jgi:DNA-binding protein
MQEKSSDVVFVGNKPPMSYVLALITTAVDVAEITRSRFIKDIKVSKIAIGTAEMPPREGENRSRMVSTIEISMAKE